MRHNRSPAERVSSYLRRYKGGMLHSTEMWALIVDALRTATVGDVLELLSHSDQQQLLDHYQASPPLECPSTALFCEPPLGVCEFLDVGFEIVRWCEARRPALRRLLFNENPNIPLMEVEAAVALWRLDGSKDAAPIILAAEWLTSRGYRSSQIDSKLKQCAQEMEGRHAIDLGIRQLLGRRRSDRLWATRCLKKSDICVVPALALLIGATPSQRNRRHRDIVARSMEILAHFGERAAFAHSSLIYVQVPTSDYSLQVRRIETLGWVARRSEEAASFVADRLNHENKLIRFAAAEALGRIGFGSPQIQERLVRALDDPHPRIRSEASRSIGMLPPEAAPTTVAALMRVLNEDSSVRVRLHAAAALGRLKPAAVDAIPALEQFLASGNVQGKEHVIRRAIKRILKRQGATGDHQP